MTTFSARLAAATFACVSLGPGLQAFAAPPAAPSVTVGADMKQLRFDAAPVAGANVYQLWFRANGGAPWVKYMETTDVDPLFKVTVSAHLLDWSNARYRVAACNADGCASTADIHVTNLMPETAGYFKPRVGALDPHGYGYDSALSADGKTFVVLSGETIGVRSRSLRAYVYRKGSSGWQQEARLEPAPVEENTALVSFTQTLAVNGDGTVIALGVPFEYIPGPGAWTNGAVYVFRRTGSVWATEKKIQLRRDYSYEVGKVVDLDDAGETLAIWRSVNDSDRNPADPHAASHQPIEIYRHTATGWESSALINTNASECHGFALSGDGKVLAQTCDGVGGVIRVYEAPDWNLRQTLDHHQAFSTSVDLNFDGSLIVTPSDKQTPAPAGATWTPWITVFRRGSAGWVADPAFTHIGGRAPNPPTGISTAFALEVAISRDGRFVAVGDPYDRNGGAGVVHSPLTLTSIQSGAVFVYEHSATAWRLRNMIKPNVAVQYEAFGWSIAFGDNGKTLAVGAFLDTSGARGIDGDQTDTSAPESGAAWLY